MAFLSPSNNSAIGMFTHIFSKDIAIWCQLSNTCLLYLPFLCLFVGCVNWALKSHADIWEFKACWYYIWGKWWCHSIHFLSDRKKENMYYRLGKLYSIRVPTLWKCCVSTQLYGNSEHCCVSHLTWLCLFIDSMSSRKPLVKGKDENYNLMSIFPHF